MGKSLLIVESPTKAKNLAKYLKDSYVVKASKGHIKDLPENRLGVDIENGFRAEYQIIEGKEKIVEELRRSAKSAERVLLGPDPDREGEAISWHIAEEISRNGSKKPFSIYRVLFYELTQKGITEALSNPGELNRYLYEAQQARRILDRLVGYLISPILWRKVRQGLSAGRVQSVALRLVCEREREIYAFNPEEYWTVDAVFSLKEEGGKILKARLVQCYGEKQCELKTQAEAEKITSLLRDASYIVRDVRRKKQKQNPPPPFITSTLQQDASRRLRFSPNKTMQIAQQLYEGIELPEVGPVGLITYMRTDSTRLADDAVRAARQFIASHWGQDFVPSKPNQYKVKSSSQDAHEAIRPTDVFRTPESVKPFLSQDQYLLYELIWKRFVACQMKPAELEKTSVDIAPEAIDGFIFRATGSVLLFSGYLTLYREITDDDTENEEESYIPSIRPGDVLDLHELKASQHFTQPPRRYSEASLIKALEDLGIGRPSTYATIVSTIQERGYVVSDKKTLRPTELGFVVNDLLVAHFPDIVDVSFTAQMEAQLDRIARGEGSMGDLLKNFYKRFKPMLDEALKEMRNLRIEGIPTDVECPNCGGSKLVIRWNRTGGSFLECPECRFRSDYERGERGELKLVSREETGETCEKCGRPMVIKRGRYGNFLACSGYPECKNTKPISLKIPCPREGCSGELVERRSKRGKVFYGCSTFPECSIVINRKPYARTCPQCGYKIMAKKEGRGGKPSVWICLNKECRFQEEVDEE